MATVVAGSSAGTLSWLGYNYLMSQAGAARGVIGRNIAKPPEADGVYAPGADNPELWWRAVPFDLHLMIFGDSSAAACRRADGLGSTGCSGREAACE